MVDRVQTNAWIRRDDLDETIRKLTESRSKLEGVMYSLEGVNDWLRHGTYQLGKKEESEA